MKISISVPMNHYHKFEVIFNTSKINLNEEYIRVYKLLSSEIIKYHEPYIEVTIKRIIYHLTNLKVFPIPVTYRLYQDTNMYVEETVVIQEY